MMESPLDNHPVPAEIAAKYPFAVNVSSLYDWDWYDFTREVYAGKCLRIPYSRHSEWFFDRPEGIEALVGNP